jgi:hypothetical protein
MDGTESTVRNMLTAIEAPLYDVGVLSERGMLPGLDGISAAAVFDRLSLLKYRNAHGSHIYIRPSGEHRFTTLDDLSLEKPLESSPKPSRRGSSSPLADSRSEGGGKSASSATEVERYLAGPFRKEVSNL